MSTILVTGGAGFIGAHVARALLSRGDTVVIMDDFNNRYDPRLKEARIAELFKDTGAPTVIRSDVALRDQVDEVFAHHKFDHVIHLAAWASVQPSISNPYIYTAVNIDGTVNILEAARKQGVKSIVFASSSSVYGGLEDVPFKESMPVSSPLSPYAATKLAGEILCATWWNLYHIPITCLRFFTVYGAWGRPEMALFRFARSILLGEQIEMYGANTQRDFTYIDDIVQGVVAAVDQPHGFAIYNLGESDAVALPRFIKAIEAALGKQASIKEVPLPAGDIPRTCADISLARSELGYNPNTSIEEGVTKFAQWYRQWYVPRFVPEYTEHSKPE